MIEALAGLRANEARYFSTQYGRTFTVAPAAEEAESLARVEEILRTERDMVIASPALEVSINEVDGILWIHVLHESGLALNVLWTRADGGKRAVGLKLSEGMEVPGERPLPVSNWPWPRFPESRAGTCLRRSRPS